MKILVYDDNPHFGGHQIMACHGIEALAEASVDEVILMYNPLNQKLVEQVSGHPNVQTLEADPERIKSLKPDLVLCLQGDIAQSAAGVRAACKAGIECVSYIAIPHLLADMGAKLGALRDLKNKPLLNKPDRFITISESMKQRLISRGCTRPISVVPNGVEIPSIQKEGRDINAPSPCVLGLAGRIEFNQKQQHFLIKTMAENPEAFEGCTLIIAGSGPDEDTLREMIQGAEHISLLPWQEEMGPFFEQIDLLIIPSRYEGVPLVMLEALARRIPVLGSRCDGMQDVLPETWTFAAEDAASMASTFSNVRETWTHKIDALQHRILEEHSLDIFKENFVRAVKG